PPSIRRRLSLSRRLPPTLTTLSSIRSGWSPTTSMCAILQLGAGATRNSPSSPQLAFIGGNNMADLTLYGSIDGSRSWWVAWMCRELEIQYQNQHSEGYLDPFWK